MVSVSPVVVVIEVEVVEDKHYKHDMISDNVMGSNNTNVELLLLLLLLLTSSSIKLGPGVSPHGDGSLTWPLPPPPLRKGRDDDEVPPEPDGGTIVVPVRHMREGGGGDGRA